MRYAWNFSNSKLKVLHPPANDSCPEFENYQITTFCRNRIVTQISPNLKQASFGTNQPLIPSTMHNVSFVK